MCLLLWPPLHFSQLAPAPYPPPPLFAAPQESLSLSHAVSIALSAIFQQRLQVLGGARAVSQQHLLAAAAEAGAAAADTGAQQPHASTSTVSPAA